MTQAPAPDPNEKRSDAPAPVVPRSVLRPKLLTTLKGYTPRDLTGDLLAGLVVGIVALPLAIAFAIASGVSPEKGLVTAIVAGFLISVLGGSRVQIGGPTGAFVVIVYGVVEKHGVEGLIIATFMAGILLVIMGLVRFGSLIRFIPHPVTVGFTSGIAVIIASSQVRDFFGLRMAAVPSEFFAKWAAFGRSAGTLNPYSLGVGLLCLAVVILWPRVSRRVPGSLVALLLGTFLVQAFHLPVETIGSRFGSIPHAFPAPRLHLVEWETLRTLVNPAMTIALLGAIESLLSATVADGMMGTRHRSNMELVAQGIANMASSLFGGIPATGAIARTATNIKNGGRTPVAGIVHALTLLFIMLVFGRYVVLVPLCGLAAILLVVAYNMSEWRSFASLLRGPRADVLVLLTTFGLTVAVDLTVAIEAGMVLALFLFMKQISESVNVKYLTGSMAEDLENGEKIPPELRAVPGDVEVFEVDGPLFFGAVQQFEEAVGQVARKPRALIIRLRNLLSIDSTGLHALEQVRRNCARQGIVLILSGVNAQLAAAFHRSGLASKVGEENIFADFGDALARAAEVP